MLSKIGAVMCSLGVMSADSYCLLIPVVMIAIGAIMVILGEDVENE